MVTWKRWREGLRVSLEGKGILNVEGQIRSPFSLHATPTRVLDRYVSGLAHMLRILGLLLHYRRHSECEGWAHTSDSVISFPVHLSSTYPMHKNALFQPPIDNRFDTVHTGMEIYAGYLLYYNTNYLHTKTYNIQQSLCIWKWLVFSKISIICCME